MDTLFFWLSKLVWLLISPDSLLLIALLLALACLVLGRERLATTLLGFACAAFLVIALFPLHILLFHPLDVRFKTNPALPDTLDGIIVQGGAEDAYRSSLWNQVSLSSGAERFITFIELAREYPEARLVFTGGTGSLTRQGYKGADVARELFGRHGLDINRIVFERESRNTYENALLTKRLVQPGKDEKWLLITTAWHLPRSVGVFCKQQWPVIPYPVDHATVPDPRLSVGWALSEHLGQLKTGLREWLGLFAYYVTGKTTALLPSACT